MYATQVLVINELSPEDVLFLHCLSPKISPILINNLTKDYELNKNNKLYVDYMNQFFKSHKKGEIPMVCEGLLNYFGTSSEELLEQGAERAKKFYEPQIEALIAQVKELTSKNYQLSSENNQLSSENSQLLFQLEQLTEQKNKLLLEHNRLTTLLEGNRKLLTQNNITY